MLTDTLVLSGVRLEDQDNSRAAVLAAGLQDSGLPHAKLAKQATKQQQRLHAERRDTLRHPNTPPSYLSGMPFPTCILTHDIGYQHAQDMPASREQGLFRKLNTPPSYLSGLASPLHVC